MKQLAQRAIVPLDLLVVLSVLLAVTDLPNRRSVPDNVPRSFFCANNGTADFAPPFHMVFYLDLKSCLPCNEDMGAWRELCAEVRARRGVISVYSKRSDSADVAWAMRLEAISDTTRVLEDWQVDALDWRRLGTPVKLLLDSQCRQLKIGGFMGNRAESRILLDQVRELVCVEDHGSASH